MINKQVMYSIGDCEPYTFNFGGTIPVLFTQDGTLTVSMFWNPCMWDKRKKPTDILQLIHPPTENTNTLNKIVLNAYNLFNIPDIVQTGFLILEPFLIQHNMRGLSVKGARVEHKNENEIIYKSNSLSYLSLFFGHYVHIAHTHRCMMEQQLPLNLVEAVLGRTLKFYTKGININKNDFFNDIFMQLLCFGMHSLNGHSQMYRSDFSGEDMNTRFGFHINKNKKSIFYGGDCEDWAQTYYQIYNTIKNNLEHFREKFKDHADLLSKMFGGYNVCNTYMARGIYQKTETKQESHTFCVTIHKQAQHDKLVHSISIIENVAPILIVPDTANTNIVIQTAKHHIGDDYTRHDQNINSMPFSRAKHKYKTILIIGKYEVFEFHHSNKKMYNGARPYTAYSEHIYFVETIENLEEIKNKLPKIESSDDKITLILVTPYILAHAFDFFTSYTEKKPIENSKLKCVQIQYYFEFLDKFIDENILCCYNENVDYVSDWCAYFLANMPPEVSRRHSYVPDINTVICISLTGGGSCYNEPEVECGVVAIQTTSSSIMNNNSHPVNKLLNEIKQLLSQLISIFETHISILNKRNTTQQVNQDQDSLVRSMLHHCIDGIHKKRLCGPMKTVVDPFTVEMGIYNENTMLVVLMLYFKIIDLIGKQ